MTHYQDCYWLIARIAVYPMLYTIPNAVLLILHIYSLAQQESWEDEYLQCANSESDCCPQSSPGLPLQHLFSNT